MIGLIRGTSRSSGTAITYITIGVLTMIWTGVWYYSMWDQTDAPRAQRYICMGLFLSGLAVTIIGLLVGQIGGAAKQADSTVAAAPVAAAPVAAAPVAQQAPTVISQQ